MHHHQVNRMLPALLAWILLLAVTSSFFIFVIPGFVAEFGTLGCILFGVEVILALFVATNFIMATFMDPGVIPNNVAGLAENVDDFRTPLYKNIEIKGINIRLKWCISCHLYRPPRSSHCAVCNQCIEMFDHHCPWVNNCIGRRNYRQFFLFLISLIVHMIFVFGISLIYCIRTKNYFSTKENVAAAVVMIICAVFFLPILGLTIFHTLLIFRARTTNEQVTGRFRGSNNPFTRGHFRNFFNFMCSPQLPSYKSKLLCKFDDNGCQNITATKLSPLLPVWDKNHNHCRTRGESYNGCDKNVNYRLKRRLQPDTSLSGNVYALNEKGCAELIPFPPKLQIDEEESFSDVTRYDVTVTQMKDKVVTNLSRSSSQVTIDTEALLTKSAQPATKHGPTRTSSTCSDCNLLDESASVRINNSAFLPENNDLMYAC